MKTPLEYVAGALRALGAETDVGGPVLRTLLLMGQPPYAAQAPTGYADRAEAWANPGGLLARLNFVQALVAGRLAGTTVDLGRFAPAGGDRPRSRTACSTACSRARRRPRRRAVIHDALVHPAIRPATLDDPVDGARRGEGRGARPRVPGAPAK